jgi:hypothetical protein
VSGQGQLALRRFRPPSETCDEKTYTEYVNKTIADDVTMDEVYELLGYYGCSVEDLVGKIVADKMGLAKAVKLRK